MDRFVPDRFTRTPALPSCAPVDNRLRLITLTRGDMWPERNACELVLVLSCRSNGFEMQGLDGHLCVGELALLPLENAQVASACGRMLSVRMSTLIAPEAPQRLRDGLIGQLLRRAWASCFTSAEIASSKLNLVEMLAESGVRAHQERLDMIDQIDSRIARVLEYIDTHIGEALNVAQLAEVAFLSAGHFSRRFKAELGISVWAYVTRRRCERAREMLLTTRLPVAEIAYRCGFAHQGHLTRCFGEQFGMTPKDARQNERV